MKERKVYCSICEDSWTEEGTGSDLRANGVRLTLCCSCEDALLVALAKRRGIKIRLGDGGEAVFPAALKARAILAVAGNALDDLEAFGSENAAAYRKQIDRILKK